MRSNTSGEDQGEEYTFPLCRASPYLRAPLQPCFSSGAGFSMASCWEKGPGRWKSRLQCLRRLAGYAAVPLLPGSVGFVQLSVLVPLQSCRKPGRGRNRYTEADDEHYSLC